MLFDTSCGGIYVDDYGCCVCKDLTQKLLEVSPLSHIATNSWDSGTGYIHYHFKNIRILGRDATMGLCFAPAGNIDTADIVLPIPNKPLDWADWSEERERQRDVVHKKILEEQLAPPYGYPWGITEANYDARTGGSSIGINYFHSEEERCRWKWKDGQWRRKA